MTISVRTLADFKRFLATPGATVQLVRHDWADPAKAKTGFFDRRTVARVQTNAVQFIGGSWLYFDRASRYRFDGDTVTVRLEGADVMVYKLSVTEAV